MNQTQKQITLFGVVRFTFRSSLLFSDALKEACQLFARQEGTRAGHARPQISRYVAPPRNLMTVSRLA
jgi:hypothetical protein